jgi:hypothetical protein
LTTIGGTVGAVWTIARADALTQEEEFLYMGGLNPRNIERAYDRVVMQLQRLLSMAKRSIRFPVTNAEGGELSLTARMGMLLGFHATTGAVELTSKQSILDDAAEAAEEAAQPLVDAAAASAGAAAASAGTATTQAGIASTKAGEASASAAAADADADRAELAADLAGAPLNSVNAATIATLKAVDVSALPGNIQANVLGYYAAGDGGGGRFYYSAASVADDDGGAVIAPTVGAGRWLAVFGPRVSVKRFGAKGDGAADDTAAIQAALEQARQEGNFNAVQQLVQRKLVKYQLFVQLT